MKTALDIAQEVMVNSRSEVLYVGLDGEMSAQNLDEGGMLIQLGLAVQRTYSQSMRVYNQDINPVFDVHNDDMLWEDAAAAVHKLTREQVATFLDPYSADQHCYDFLIENGADPKRRAKTIPVGFNVGAFDMPFVRATLPKTNSLFSRQTVDLNALCFGLSVHTLYEGRPASMGAWKKLAKDYADTKIGEAPGMDWRPHNAGYDATHALYAFDYLSQAMQQ